MSRSWSGPLLAGLVQTAAAQAPRGTIDVRVAADFQPVAEAAVRVGRIGALTGAAGTARLAVPTGSVWVVATRVGYHVDSVQVSVTADRTVAAFIRLTAQDVELEELTVSATRGARRVEDDPVRVEVLGGEDVAEKTQMRPSDLSQLLSEMVGVRLQPGGGALGATRLRIAGLRGQYTGLLADGLPLYGGQSGGFNVLQLAPLDLKQAEVIKGAATALYGPSALGGLLNLVSRRPDDGPAELVARQSGQGGSDLLSWSGFRLSPTAGLSLFADVHRQSRRDVDGADGWLDVPGFTRVSLRPRLFVDAPNGDGLFATLGYSHEQRDGGFAAGDVPGGTAYAESLRTDRVDAGLAWRRLHVAGGKLAVRLSGTLQDLDHQFGASPERQRRTTLFGEASWSARKGAADWVVGAAWQRDAVRAEDTPVFNFTFRSPAAFGQLTLALAPAVRATFSGRCDGQNVYGTKCSPRAGLLVRPVSELSVRLSAAAGAFTPSPFTDETDALGLRFVVPSTVRRETARTGSFDVSWKHGALELGGTLAASRLADPVIVVPIAGDPQGRLTFQNGASPTKILSGEVFGVYDLKPLVATVFYGYLHAREADRAGGRREQALTPRHAGGFDVTWEDGAHGTWIAIEAFYTGVQTVDDDPARTTTRPYAIAEVLASQRIGPAQLFVNLENLFDQRLTRRGPLLLSSLGAGQRRTVTPWMPLEGRVLSAGIRTHL